MLPTIRQLHYLKLLAEHGAFGRAAEAAHVTQPTLSAGIQELARSGVILTAVGEEALRRATTILNEAEELVQAAKNAGQPLTGRFRLGVIPTVAPYLLPGALPILRTRFPKLRLFLREDLTQRLVQALRAGQLDAALIALPYDMTGLAWAHVSEDELLAATPADHPMAHLSEITPDALEQEELILLEDGHCLRDHALAACGLRPPRPSAAEEESFAATSLPTLVQMVGSGLGVSFLPAMAVSAGLTNAVPVAVRPIAGNHPNREIVVAWRAGSSRAVEGRLLAEALRDA
jgi:LysR family hydrogen peroxide-inducible transcriptional activator